MYVEQPGFENFHFFNHVFKLKKTMNGLKEAPRAYPFLFIMVLTLAKLYLCKNFAKCMQDEFKMSMMETLNFFFVLQIK